MPEYWTLKHIRAVAGKCKSRGEFAKRFPTEYHVAWRFGWLDKIGLPKRVRSEKSFRAIKEAARKFSSRTEFNRKARRLYDIASQKGWLDKLSFAGKAS